MNAAPNSQPQRVLTAPVSSPLDTLKALVLRNIDALDFVTDRLVGGYEIEAPDYVLEFLDGIRQQQYRALAEHMPVGRDELLGELRALPREAYVYDDGSPVAERLTSPPGVVSVYYPRYDGDRDEFTAKHQEAVEQISDRVVAEEAPAVIHDLEAWRSRQNGEGGDA